MSDETGLRYGMHDIPIDEYHADKQFHTASMYKRFHKSPALMTCTDTPANTSLSVGTLTHALALQDDAQLERIRAYDGVRRGKAYQQWKEDLPPDAVECTIAEWDTAKRCATALHEDRVLGELLSTDRQGFVEKTICWYDKWEHPNYGYVMQDCKMRPDFLLLPQFTIVDIKTTATFSEHDLIRTIWKYGYQIQLAHYITGAASYFHRTLADVRFVFAFVETKEPYRTAAIMLDDDTIEKALEQRTRIQRKFIECVDLGDKFVDPLSDNLSVVSLPEFVFDD